MPFLCREIKQIIMKSRVIITCAAGLLALASCGGHPSVRFSSYEYSDTIGYNGSGSPCIAVNISVPYVEGDGAFARAFNSDVCSFLFNADGDDPSVSQAARMAVGRKVAEFRSDTRERLAMEDALAFDYDYHVTARAESRDDAGIVNLYTTVYTFQGGAHGGTFCSCRNYDMKDGHLVRLEDIMPAGYEKGMVESLRQALLKETGCPSWDRLGEYGYFPDVEMYIPEHYAIGADSVSFIFNQYEIAPYSTGITTLTVSRP